MAGFVGRFPGCDPSGLLRTKSGGYSAEIFPRGVMIVLMTATDIGLTL
jgi:hypothetical protein